MELPTNHENSVRIRQGIGAYILKFCEIFSFGAQTQSCTNGLKLGINVSTPPCQISSPLVQHVAPA